MSRFIKIFYCVRIVLVRLSRKMEMDNPGSPELHDIDWAIESIDDCFKQSWPLNKAWQKELLEYLSKFEN